MLGVNLGSVGFSRGGRAGRSRQGRGPGGHAGLRGRGADDVDVVVHKNGNIVHTDWALNEAAVQKAGAEKLLESCWRLTGAR